MTSVAPAARPAGSPEALPSSPPRALSMINPLSYEVEALRGMLLGTPARLPLDFAVLVAALLAGITAAAMLLPRLAR